VRQPQRRRRQPRPQAERPCWVAAGVQSAAPPNQAAAQQACALCVPGLRLPLLSHHGWYGALRSHARSARLAQLVERKTLSPDGCDSTEEEQILWSWVRAPRGALQHTTALHFAPSPLPLPPEGRQARPAHTSPALGGRQPLQACRGSAGGVQAAAGRLQGRGSRAEGAGRWTSARHPAHPASRDCARDAGAGFCRSLGALTPRVGALRCMACRAAAARQRDRRERAAPARTGRGAMGPRRDAAPAPFRQRAGRLGERRSVVSIGRPAQPSPAGAAAMHAFDGSEGRLRRGCTVLSAAGWLHRARPRRVQYGWSCACSDRALLCRFACHRARELLFQRRPAKRCDFA
jgi:hypothetical protein